MGRIEHRLERLERLAASCRADKCGSPRHLDSYFRALENFNREKVGHPALPYSVEDRRDDEEFLLETLPSLRASLGWQTEEARHVLDEWEKHTLEKLVNVKHY